MFQNILSGYDGTGLEADLGLHLGCCSSPRSASEVYLSSCVVKLDKTCFIFMATWDVKSEKESRKQSVYPI